MKLDEGMLGERTHTFSMYHFIDYLMSYFYHGKSWQTQP